MTHRHTHTGAQFISQAVAWPGTGGVHGWVGWTGAITLAFTCANPRALAHFPAPALEWRRGDRHSPPGCINPNGPRWRRGTRSNRGGWSPPCQRAGKGMHYLYPREVDWWKKQTRANVLMTSNISGLTWQNRFSCAEQDSDKKHWVKRPSN